MTLSSPVPMKDPGDYIDFDDAEKLIAVTKDLRNKVVIALLWRCGLRAFEVGRLKWKHFNEEDNVIVVEGKGDKAARVPLEPGIFEWLSIMKTTKGPEEWVIPGHKGVGIERTTVWRIVQKASKDSGILVTKGNNPVHPHCLRHSLAIWLVKMGVPIPKIQQILRHSSLHATTYYLQFSTKELSEDYLKAWETMRNRAVDTN